MPIAVSCSDLIHGRIKIGQISQAHSRSLSELRKIHYNYLNLAFNGLHYLSNNLLHKITFKRFAVRFQANVRRPKSVESVGTTDPYGNLRTENSA